MESSSSDSDANPSAKAALDHLQMLIEQLVRENHNLKLSLQQTRSHLDQVRQHLNQFKLQVAEQETHDRLLRKQIRNMAALVLRHRDPTSAPLTPDLHPTPPSSVVRKSPSQPHTPTQNQLPADQPNVSQPHSVSQTTSVAEAVPLPLVSCKPPRISKAHQSDPIQCRERPAVVAEEIKPSGLTSPAPTHCDASTSRSLQPSTAEGTTSPPNTSVTNTMERKESPAFVSEQIQRGGLSRSASTKSDVSTSRLLQPPTIEGNRPLPGTSAPDALHKAFVASSASTLNEASISRSLQPPTIEGNASPPDTSVTDALQKAFVAMENDTTNTVQVLHNTKHALPCQKPDKAEFIQANSQNPKAKEASLVTNTHDINKLLVNRPVPNLKKRTKSSRQRSSRSRTSAVAGMNPTSDNDISAPSRRTFLKAENGPLKRILSRRQSPGSPSEPKDHLAKHVGMKKTKKGYKLSLGVSRGSTDSGGSSSSSSDSDSGSDSSGPGYSATLSGPLNRPSKAQVSMEGGLSDFVGAAHKLKDNLEKRKKSHGNSDSDSDEDTESGGDLSESVSDNADATTDVADAASAILPGVAVAGGTAALCAAAQSGDYQGSHPSSPGYPKIGEHNGDQNGRLHEAAMMNQNDMNGGRVWQPNGQSNPYSYANANNFDSAYAVPGVTGTPHNPVPESAKMLNSSGPANFAGTVPNGIHPTDVGNLSQIAAGGNDASEDSEHQSLTAADHAMDDGHTEASAEVENPIIREITHVPERPKSFANGDTGESTMSSSEMKQSTSNTTELLTINAHNAEMLPWQARRGSKYVDASEDALAVKHPAAISQRDGKVIMNGKMRVLKPVGTARNSRTLCFVSPIYPDGTFLPYVPVSEVVLHGRPVHWNGTPYADREAQISLSKELFDTLVLHTRRAYRRKYPGSLVNIPGAFLAGHRVRKVVRIEPDCSVNMTSLHRTASKCSVVQALTTIKQDIVGLVLLYIGIERRTEENKSADMIFGLHSMVAHGLSVERRR